MVAGFTERSEQQQYLLFDLRAARATLLRINCVQLFLFFFSIADVWEENYLKANLTPDHAENSDTLL